MDIDYLHLDSRSPFPNNRLPVILYRGAIAGSGRHAADAIESLFESNGWAGTWRNGIFDFHHFHAEAHEVLGCAAGWVDVQLGGPEVGELVHLEAGDVALLPAGTSHCNMGHSADYLIIGAYPPEQQPDMKYGEPDEFAAAQRAIDAVPHPTTDPVQGHSGPALSEWSPQT